MNAPYQSIVNDAIEKTMSEDSIDDVSSEERSVDLSLDLYT
jgi:hypothetical protein